MWTKKKAEDQKTGAFKLWCWRRLLKVPGTARRSNPSILKEINPEYSLETLMLKLQYFGHLMQRADSLEKTLILGKIEGKRRKGRQRMRRLDSITNSMGMNLSKLQDTVKDRRARQLNNNYILLRKFCLLIFRKYQQLLFLFYIYIRVYIHMYVCVYMYSVSVCTHRPRLRYTHTHMY